MFFDALVGQGVYTLGGSRPPGRSSPWGGAAERGGPVDGGAGNTDDGALGSPSAPAWEPAPSSGPAVAAKVLQDKDLQGDLVKLVRYAIVSVRRCEERILPAGSGEILVTDSMTSESFATWMVALYLQSDEYRAAVARDRRNRLSHQDKKYLRVAYEVLERWPREPLSCCQEDRLGVLESIRDAIRGLAVRPARTAVAPSVRAPFPRPAALPPAPEPPPAPPAEAERTEVAAPEPAAIAPPAALPPSAATEEAPAGEEAVKGAAEAAAERAAPGEDERRVLQALADSGNTAATGQLVHLTGLGKGRVREAIKGLEAAGRVRRVGESFQTRYQLVEPEPAAPRGARPSRRKGPPR
jgi:hypothetical protein